MAVLRNADPMPGTVDFFARPPCPAPAAEIREILQWIIAGMQQRAAGFRILFERVVLDRAFAERFTQYTPHHQLVATLEKHLATVWPKQADPAGAAEVIVALGFQLGFVDPELLGRDQETISTYLERKSVVLARGLVG